MSPSENKVIIIIIIIIYYPILPWYYLDPAGRLVLVVALLNSAISF